ncbi:MAG: hypothetical protein AAGK04_14510, partial [Planctomycetota bacterium]
TPDGRISRYIHGLDYPSRDVRLSLLEAAEGNLTESLGDMITGFCFRWDPNAGGYTLQAFRVMQIGGVVTVVALVILLGMLFFGERVRRRLRARSVSAAPSASPTVTDPSTGASASASTATA